MRTIYLLLPFITGVALTTQAAINGQLRTAINSPLLATFISFIVGTIFLLIIILFSTQKDVSIHTFTQVAWYKYTGGLLGSFIVMAIILSIKNISPSALFALVVAGQLITAIVFEQFGVLGVKLAPINWTKFIGVIMLIAAVYLINRKE
jgi:transporter family-2 protein